ncbi:MAG: HD domain-containing protein [Planctomycetes bacterium]|nr:HD domain-containing protein [Planctomycetota bacterium]
MSMTVATQLSVPQDQVLHLGVGALIHDVGMLRVPPELRQAPRQLTEAERFEVSRHPLHTLDCLERVGNLNDLSLIVAYQIHERGDRSGYPRQRPLTTIHPLARLAAIADTYAAITAQRPHRNARGPYEAMETLLRETSRNRFDRQVMRCFLDCISLFPIGSYVRLSNGQLAKVLRANPGLHTQPVVVPLHDDGTESGIELDLSCEHGLAVIQALRDDHELAIARANGTRRQGARS